MISYCKIYLAQVMLLAGDWFEARKLCEEIIQSPEPAQDELPMLYFILCSLLHSQPYTGSYHVIPTAS